MRGRRLDATREVVLPAVSFNQNKMPRQAKAPPSMSLMVFGHFTPFTQLTA